jgi:hypothetical protein
VGADALSESTVFDFIFITPNTITVHTKVKHILVSGSINSMAIWVLQ